MAKSKAPPILRHFQLMPEWLGQSALRIAGDDGIFDEIGAEEAGFSETIADRFEDWMDAFDAIYDEDDPPSSCFESSAEFDAWRRDLLDPTLLTARDHFCRPEVTDVP